MQKHTDTYIHTDVPKSFQKEIPIGQEYSLKNYAIRQNHIQLPVLVFDSIKPPISI